jgi:glucokinase
MDRGVIVGIDLGATFIKAGLITQNGQIITQLQRLTEATQGRKKVVENIAFVIKHLIDNQKRDSILGIGIGSPGYVLNGQIVGGAENIKDWENVPLREIIEKRFSVPTFVDNDVNTVTLGEKVFGLGKRSKNFICITLGTGIGAGLVLNGQLYRGARGYAGEIGHTTVDYKGWLCNCGSRGCLEAYAGTEGILARAQVLLKKTPQSILRKSQERLTPKIICEAAKKGDPVAQEVVKEVGEYIGVGLANVVNLLNLDRVIIGGGISQAGRVILEPIKASLKRYTLNLGRKGLKVNLSILGARAGLLGSAVLVLEKMEQEVKNEREYLHF